jgi:hypothetical protein
LDAEVRAHWQMLKAENGRKRKVAGRLSGALA